MKIKAYGFPNTRSLRVVWALEEAGLDYEYCCVNLMQGETRSKVFMAKNAAGKLPVLELDGEYISESAALVNLIATLAPKSQLIPLDNGLERARYDQWSQFAVCELEQPIWTMTKHKFALPEKVRCGEIFKTAAWEYQQALALLSEGLGTQDYILGRVITGADILLGHSLFWGDLFKQEIGQQNLRDYMARLRSRKAFCLAHAREQEAFKAARVMSIN